jgi:hypothetical protein
MKPKKSIQNIKQANNYDWKNTYLEIDKLDSCNKSKLAYAKY